MTVDTAVNILGSATLMLLLLVLMLLFDFLFACLVGRCLGSVNCERLEALEERDDLRWRRTR